jgi:hypothetical protein
MKRTVFPFRLPAHRRAWWRNQAGIGILEVVTLVAVLTVAASAIYFSHLKNKGENPIIGGAQDQAKLNVCLAQLEKAKADLSLMYPPGETIPLDDPNLKFILDCKRDIKRILKENEAAAQDPKWAGLLEQLKDEIKDIGMCSFEVTFPKSKPAGQKDPVSVGLAATIPLSDPNVVGMVQASTGETAKLTRTGKLKFDGNIFLNGADKVGGTEVTLSLTPTGEVSVACPTAVFTWKDPLPYTVTLLPPAGGNSTTEGSVTVIGQVTPAPPAGTSVAINIKVNGKPGPAAQTDSNGNFSASVSLPNTTTIDNLKLTNSGKTVTTCGLAKSPISLENTKNPVALANTISATALAEGGGNASKPSEPLTISHAVKVTEVQINWSGQCPGPPETQPGGQVLGGNEKKRVGVVHCGTPCPGSGTDCTATATVTVLTSVGSLFSEALWTIKIP